MALSAAFKWKPKYIRTRAWIKNLPDEPQPSPWIFRFSSGFAARKKPEKSRNLKALDLAAGSGRHTRLLLDLNFEVTALDRNLTRLATYPANPRLTLIEWDLEAEPGGSRPFRRGAFDLIVVTNYLWRPLLADLAPALAPGGRLIYETFGYGNARYGRPKNPDYLLQPNELLKFFSGDLDIVAFEQGFTATPKPAVIQRICTDKPAE